ncbi:Eif2s3y [Ephemerocybe angulata]|uniref:Eif2s3y n=1 Tax=Ephemerocybe angulata TaxID=980116 RepID=A0A8H6HPE6_9AGAR|nr:Eif2s3y [Tulosesus angulatus]
MVEFAINSSINVTTGFAPFELNLGYMPRMIKAFPEGESDFPPGVEAHQGRAFAYQLGSTSTGGRVLSVKADLAKIQLTSPACTEVGEKVALSRRIEKHWRLVGWGSVQCGTVLEVD